MSWPRWVPRDSPEDEGTKIDKYICRATNPLTEGARTAIIEGMRTTKKSASLIAAIIFAAAGGDALGQYAVWQVNQPTDYAREPTQLANRALLTDIKALTDQIRQLSAMIENSTRLTEQHTNKMQRDIEIMRRIGQKRQELTLSLARLEALTTQGNVFKDDPWARAVATSGVTGTTLEKVFTEMGSYGKDPLDIGNKLKKGGVDVGRAWTATSIDGGAGMGVEQQDGQGGTMWGESFALEGEYGLDVQSGSSSYSTVTLPENVMEPVLGRKQSLLNLSYNDYGFVGLGARYMENVVGVAGRVVAMDYVPPFSNILLNDQQKDILKRILNQRARGGAFSGYKAATGDSNPFEIYPGVIVRPRTEADTLYEKMVLNGTPESESTFWASAAVYGGSQYDPARGFSPEGKFPVAVNMNDVLSNGGYSAVQEYNKQHGIATNPYGQFAKAVAPVLTDRLAQTKPGAKLVISAEDVRTGQAAGADQGLSSFGIPATTEEWIGVFARSKKVHGDWIKASAALGDAPRGRCEYGSLIGLSSDTIVTTDFCDQDGDGVDDRYQTGPGIPPVRGDEGRSRPDRTSPGFPMTDGETGGPAPLSPPSTEIFVGLGLSRADTREYTSKIMANSARLSENNMSLLMTVLTAKYNQECLEKVIALEEELKRLSDGADAESIIETLPMMRQNAQNTILVLQNRLAQLQAQVETQLQAKYAALNERQQIVQSYRDTIRDNGRGVVERLLTLASPLGL